MVTQNQEPNCLVVGNYCHDVLIKDDAVLAESLGGAVSFISAVLDGLSVPSQYVAKVGSDFAYPVNHRPMSIPSSKTTLFHAYFSSEIKLQDRVLKRVTACEPIFDSDLSSNAKFNFGMAVGVGGEILPETLEKMIDLCNLVLVDIQALIRVFDDADGKVRQVDLKETEFYRLLPKIGVLKASSEEAPYVDVEEARKWCCVVVTNGKDGCTVYWKDGELQIAPFPTVQVDPTGAGDSFLGGFVAGLVHGLSVPDAALLGNFFGSLTVGQLGLPKFDLRILQSVKNELDRRSLDFPGFPKRQDNMLKFAKSSDHEQFHNALSAAKVVSANPVDNSFWSLSGSPRAVGEQHGHHHSNGHQNVLVNSVYEAPIKSADT
ncbi:OLC1v1006218C1 [Oldenlandia corymbosa var. corymbosa]|uniref:OLC1v1006218C1 n=1 Tax=Oldenlandia corymbosa var. corymbosa TaxID=529605 RepID=A0AAV1DGG3_OLDCO|nr:OLC1v1006218C1 [Oldenlandia corymbosa var. corymbosa]